MDNLTRKERDMEEILYLYPHRYWRGISIEQMMFANYGQGQDTGMRLIQWCEISRALDEALNLREKTFVSFTYWMEADWKETCKACRLREWQWNRFRKKVLRKLITFLGL